MSMEYIRKTYNVPAKRGTKVKISCDRDIEFDGVIVASKGARLKIRVNGRIGTYHPSYCIEYL